MDSEFTRDCDSAIFTYATALELGFRFATDGGKSLWFDWPPDLSPIVRDEMSAAIEKNLPIIIALVAQGCGGEAGEERSPPNTN
jgi:hypothetical protein